MNSKKQVKNTLFMWYGRVNGIATGVDNCQFVMIFLWIHPNIIRKIMIFLICSSSIFTVVSEKLSNPLIALILCSFKNYYFPIVAD